MLAGSKGIHQNSKNETDVLCFTLPPLCLCFTPAPPLDAGVEECKGTTELCTAFLRMLPGSQRCVLALMASQATHSKSQATQNIPFMKKHVSSSLMYHKTGQGRQGKADPYKQMRTPVRTGHILRPQSCHSWHSGRQECFETYLFGDLLQGSEPSCW